MVLPRRRYFPKAVMEKLREAMAEAEKKRAKRKRPKPKGGQP